MIDSVGVVLGTRPEIIKLAPVVQACSSSEIDCTVIHTGQHYSENLDSVFFDQLELPDPDHDLSIGSGTHGEQTGRMLIDVERVIRRESPDVVLVQGDTNSVLAGALATSKLDVLLGHVEAGLRSFDRGMPEEINRIVADHVSDYLFAPTEQSRELLLEEGLPSDRITVTGNTIVDSVYRHRDIARRKSSILSDLGLRGRDFFLMTAHRAENVDRESRFRQILAGVETAATEHQVEVIYPIHPRAEKRLDEFGIEVPSSVRTVEPLEYLDFLKLESEANLIMTDSGGVQEEACILRVPCVTMRDNTERPETVDVGANRLSSVDSDAITRNINIMMQKHTSWDNPFGGGTAAEQILDELVAEEGLVEL